jgi:hypothetical protein
MEHTSFFFSGIPLLDSSAFVFGHEVAKIRHKKKPCLGHSRTHPGTWRLNIDVKKTLKTIRFESLGQEDFNA